MKFIIKFLGFLIIIFLSGSNSNERDVYLFSYFKNNGNDGLHLAYSFNGLKWTALNNDKSFLKPEAGKDKLMRDPCIIRGPDGMFHMVWTVSWNEKGIGYAGSKDLIHWSNQQYIPVMKNEPDAKNCWAPELFYDEIKQQYLIFWATTIPGKFPETDDQDNRGKKGEGYNHRIYYVTTKDFYKFSNTKILFNQGFNVIDAAIIKADKNYVMFLKDETNKPGCMQKNIRIAMSQNAEGPYKKVSKPITGKYWAEGPTVIFINDRWYLYFDKYRLKKYGLLVSKDLIRWIDKSDSLEYPEGMRHGTVFKIDETLLNRLLQVK
jgi:hypothetical protein